MWNCVEEELKQCPSRHQFRTRVIVVYSCVVVVVAVVMVVVVVSVVFLKKVEHSRTLVQRKVMELD